MPELRDFGNGEKPWIHAGFLRLVQSDDTFRFSFMSVCNAT